jgi:hypothetical protein
VCEVDIDCDDNMACSVDSCEDEGTRSAYEPVVCRDRTDCTVSGNIDEDSGVISTFEGTLTWTNTLIDGDCSIASTAVASNGHNIESPGNTCGFDHGTDLVNITEGQLDLGPLQDNGGLTTRSAASRSTHKRRPSEDSPSVGRRLVCPARLRITGLTQG